MRVLTDAEPDLEIFVLYCKTRSMILDLIRTTAASTSCLEGAAGTLADPRFLVIAMIQRLWGQSFLRSPATTIVAVGRTEEYWPRDGAGKPIPIQAIIEMRRRIKKTHPFGKSLMRSVGNEEGKRLGGVCDQISSRDAVNRRNTLAKYTRLDPP